MTCAIADLARRGFTANLRAVDGALRASTGETLWPRDLVIREVHRFEGVSDPDDMEVLYAIKSVSGVRGTLADAFGVYADPATGTALRDVPIRLPVVQVGRRVLDAAEREGLDGSQR